MILPTEELALMSTVRAIAEREYRRGLESGWNIAGVAVNWLRMNKGRKPAYTQEEIATMIETRLKEESARSGGEV